ncbi:protein transport protein bos1 [Entophlyctis luteolus]|nr:protein transport protein bos1 [Entophlyctis luteolus]
MSSTLIFNNASRAITQTQADLDRFAAHLDSQAAAAPFPLAGQLHSNLELLRQASKDLSDIAKREITTVKREKALTRSNSVHADYLRLKSLHDDLRRRSQESVAAERERSELMGTLARDASSSGNSSGGGITQFGRRHAYGRHDTPDGSAGGQNLNDTSTILMMDGLLRENEVLTATDGRLDEFIQMGRGALSELYEQRQILKATQKRMYSIATSLGLSASVIKYIEKRANQDRWVLFGGMLVTLLLMWAIAHFFGK